MKRLYLVRHAKSSWKNPNLTDYDRPLNKRGKRDAPFMAKLAAEKKIIPNVLYISSANRAQLTAYHFIETLHLKVHQCKFSHDIYDSTPHKLLDIIRQTDENNRFVMLIGHNPEITILANQLSDQYIENMPTCGILGIEFGEVTWKNISKGKQVLYEYPKKYFPKVETE